MSRRTVIFVTLGVALVCGIVAVMLFVAPRMNDKTGELAQKREWSVLQVLEYKNRKNKSTGGILVVRQADGSEYNALGLPLVNQDTGYAWILANPSSLPRVKLLPSDAMFRITVQELEQIQREIELDAVVLRFLKQNAVK